MDVTLTGERSSRVGFEDFFGLEYARLVRSMYLLCGDGADAEDMAQEAFARVFERWDRIQAMESPIGYLYRTALNINRRRVRQIAAFQRGAAIHSEEAIEGINELQADVRRALLGLSPNLRVALVLAEWLQMTSEEAGRVLGIAPSSFRVRLHRARSELRQRLGSGYE
jgi:RNA polymerase sigma-70 factor (ECF subfamily)